MEGVGEGVRGGGYACEERCRGDGGKGIEGVGEGGRGKGREEWGRVDGVCL